MKKPDSQTSSKPMTGNKPVIGKPGAKGKEPEKVEEPKPVIIESIIQNLTYRACY